MQQQLDSSGGCGLQQSYLLPTPSTKLPVCWLCLSLFLSASFLVLDAYCGLLACCVALTHIHTRFSPHTHTHSHVPTCTGITSGDAVMLELAAAEMAQAAALFVALEKEVEVLRVKGAEAGVIALKDTAR